MGFEQTGGGVLWRGDGEIVRIDAWGDGIRVRASRTGSVEGDDFALLPEARRDAVVEIDARTARIVCGAIVVVAAETDYGDWSNGFDTTRLHLSFQDPEGRILFEEIGDGGALKLKARQYLPSEFGGAALRVAFTSSTDEHLAGMGLYAQPFIDLKGTTLELAHRNSQSSVPFLLSSDGYGLLWNNPAIGRATFGRNRTEWAADAADRIDYWVTAGATPKQILAAYADATGHAPMMPEYGLGFWQCKLRYWNQEQLLEVAREYARREIPLDVIVADFFHWPKMGDYRFEDEFWPDPTAMVAELANLGTKLMVSVWPQVSPQSENFAELQSEDLLVKARSGTDVQMFFDGQYVRFLDATNPRTRTWLRERLDKNYGSHGIDLFWLDEAEPEYGSYDFGHFLYAAGPTAKAANLYPRDFVRMVMRDRPASESNVPVTLVRAAWAGSQRYGALVWSGDVHSSWTDFRAQLTAGIHLGVAGIPWFTTDIGGFGGGNPDDPAFRELLVRWFQFGAFSPVMRLHGDRTPASPVTTASGADRLPTGGNNEVWSFGSELEPLLIDLIRLREDLRPYTRELMVSAHERGEPVMRGLFYEFPDDPRAWTVDDAYLFGPDILVAPVLQAGARSRTVYLPEGAEWIDVRTGATRSGGQEVEIDTPLPVFGVFARSRRVLPYLRRLQG